MNKVCVNIQQDFSEAQKAQARANIGAAASSDIPASPVQSDWDEANTSSLAYIQNKPTIPALHDYIYSNATLSELNAELDSSNNGTLVGSYSGTNIPLGLLPPIPDTGDSGKVLKVDVNGRADWDSDTQGSTVKTLDYGAPAPSNVSTLLIDSDDPEGYALVKADNVTKGHLVIGPYKDLLDSGVSGVGGADAPIYIDSNGTFQQCNTLSAGAKISINPGANNTTVISNAMHESVVNTCLIWDTLANNYDFDYYWGNWRVHVHLAAFSDWAQDDSAIHIRIEHVYKSEAAQKIKCGSYQVQSFYPYQGGNTYDFSNAHWYYDGADPYTTATNPDPYGFKFHLNNTTPTRQMPTDQKAHRFIVDTGAPYGEWLELDASVRYLVPNAAPSGNAIYLLLKGKYAYTYV